MNSIPPPVSLLKVFHHRQQPNAVPSGDVVKPFIELVIVMLDGRGWMHDGEEWREVTAGDLIWLAPGDRNIGRADPENLFRCLAVEFKVSRPEGMGIRRFSKWTNTEEIELLTQESTRRVWNEKFDRNALRDYLYFRFLYQVRAYELALSEPQYPGPVGAVMARIERDFSCPLRIEELAKEAGWSVFHLHNEFQKQTQNTPHQTLIQQRIHVAKERLLCTSDSVKEIAVYCGFFDVAAFANTFKTHTGETPSAFRTSRWLMRNSEVPIGARNGRQFAYATMGNRILPSCEI